jgi:hypothetical protein
MPMKRGFDITHGWLKTGFFDDRTSLQPASRAKNPVCLVLTRKFCSTKRAELKSIHLSAAVTLALRADRQLEPG